MEAAGRSSVRQNHEINFRMKLELIQEAESNPNLTQKALAKKYGIGKSTVGDILRRQKYKLLQMKMNTDLMLASTPSPHNQTAPSLSSAQDELSYEQVRQNLIACENYTNKYNIDDKFAYGNNNNDLHADEQDYEDGAMNDEDEVTFDGVEDESDFCPPVKTILHEPEPQESLLRTNNCLSAKRSNENVDEPSSIKRRKLSPTDSLVLFAGVDLRHILSPVQLQKCYAALRLPRLNSKLPQKCRENDEKLDEDMLDIDENSSEISDADAEYSEMSLEDAYELTQHLYNSMKKLLPQGVPYIRKCKILMEKSLGMPITGHQTKISDFFGRIKKERTT